MTSSLLVRTFTAVLSAGFAFAGSSIVTTLGGPRLGLVFDRAAGGLRPIGGIPVRRLPVNRWPWASPFRVRKSHPRRTRPWW